MDQFEKAMLKQGVSIDKINVVKNSPVWIKRIRDFSPHELDIFILAFPKMYPNKVIDDFYSHPSEFEKAAKQYVPMDLS